VNFLQSVGFSYNWLGDQIFGLYSKRNDDRLKFE